RMLNLAVSPDGQWLASGGWREAGIQIWNLPERRFERLLVPGEGGGDLHFWVAFAPDGRLVCTTATEEKMGHYTFRVDSWKRELIAYTPDLIRPGAPVYSRDGALMACCVSPRQIRLSEATTFRPVAHL